MNKIKVAAVSYLNTKPLLYGIEHHPVRNDIDLIVDYPAKVAQMVIEGQADVGLIPVAAIPKIKDAHIITDYCIGCDGAVASVCIFSEVPIEKIKAVMLDYQSKTSVQLARLLLKEYWKKGVEFIKAAGEDYRTKIRGTTAGVVIGDRALEQRLVSPYIYDLGWAWKEHTGLPFVFAAWVANKELPEKFIIEFNEANKEGLWQVEKVIDENPYSVFDLKKYYTEYIDYYFSEHKRLGLEIFLRKQK